MRVKNKKEKLGGLIKGFAKGVDEVLLASQKVDYLKKIILFYSALMYCD